MKGVVFPGDRKVAYLEIPDPTPGPLDVVIEMKASGMCGTDLQNYRRPARSAGIHALAYRQATDRRP